MLLDAGAQQKQKKLFNQVFVETAQNSAGMGFLLANPDVAISQEFHLPCDLSFAGTKGSDIASTMMLSRSIAVIKLDLKRTAEKIQDGLQKMFVPAHFRSPAEKS